MEAVTGQSLKFRNLNADRKVVETVEELIAIYKREFGDNWQAVFRETVSVFPGQS
jgi:hypothetical protein